MTIFNYMEAFSRNLGWVHEWEQQALRHKRVAIVGMGGVGGTYLLALARLGIENFHIAEFDHFELANFNRQIGANMDTIGQPKIEVLKKMAHAINPDAQIVCFPEGIKSDNIGAFLDGVDLFFDGIDFFVIDMRRALFAECAKRKIPAFTAAPLGMGTGYLAFMPGGMTFEEYFAFGDASQNEQYLKFLLGLAPAGLHRSYLVDPTYLNLAAQRGPSTIAGIQLCSGVVAAACVKILLNRGTIKPAPYYHHFDAYTERFVCRKLPGGNNNIMQRLKFSLGKRQIAKMAKASTVAHERPIAGMPLHLDRILESARWVQSGDNTQPWKFSVEGDDTIHIFMHDTSGQNFYEYHDGEPMFLSIGMMLENIRLAALRESYGISWAYVKDTPAQHTITVRLEKRDQPKLDPLLPYVWLRSVDRRPFRLKELTKEQKNELENCFDASLKLRWHETIQERWRIAQLSALGTDIRLTMPETFDTHRNIIDWVRVFSPTKIPAKALGIDVITLRIMRWALQSWKRSKIVNTWMGGAFLASLQMDYLPGLCSSAYFSLSSPSIPPDGHERQLALIKIGQALQRFWLTATKLGLAIQPASMIPLLRHYASTHKNFSINSRAIKKAAILYRRSQKVLSGENGDLVFMGRIGSPLSEKKTRSIRKSLSELMGEDKSGL